MMNILITGAKGFIGKNLVEALKNIRDGKDRTWNISTEITILEYNHDSDPELLDEYCRKADFVFNLAGVNRPKDPSEFMAGNFGFASTLINLLKKNYNTCPIVFSSSIQALLDNPYGKSKKTAEDLFFLYAHETGAKVLVYRFPNLFGKWCRPNYNSVIATFCHNTAHDLPIQISDPSVMLNFVYIDDLVIEMIHALQGKANRARDGFCYVDMVHTEALGHIAELIQFFKSGREKLEVPNMGDAFTKKLYATYLSYLPEDKFCFPLKMNCDGRGSFTEIIRTPERGQFSVNISKPGIIKGNHWHNTKNEKVIVVSGRGIIRFRKIGDTNVVEYPVNGDTIEAVDIPPGYTHNIENTGEIDMVTIMWANECFDPDKPDTYYEEV
ncbi:UDP-2-acetamido-2,6-beta-L-arabino-hexul-4-ose reductase [bioreactor metagenome]|uniref:UDP-2-acetamido-2,6-beta-L-arabino-hexul-4-ose reductase n=1 Tax=bioreactor metagenome TaxID=1076179 RepID=A0A644ZUE3_9ZZZZ